MKICKLGFTLSEVLSTLGIIGIIVALTLPTVIQNKQRKNMQVTLQKTYSELGALNQRFIADFGMNMCEYSLSFLSGTAMGGTVELASQMGKYLGKSESNISYNTAVSKIKNFTGDKSMDPACMDDGFFIDKYTRTFFFERAKAGINECPMITVDINGYYKGPNKMGYDIFSFRPTFDGRFIGMGQEIKDGDKDLQRGMVKCSTNRKSDNWNGHGCTYYALIDINPDNNKKKYWSN